MTTHDPVQRVRIYLSERDTSAGQPLYLAVLERLRREGATGATAIRGVAGFGASHRLRTAGPADLSQAAPIVIEWIDRAERVARVLPTLDDLLPDALITIEDLRVHRAALRSTGPFGERSVGEVMMREVAVASRQTPLAEAVQLMLERHQPLLPVLDPQGQIVSVVIASDLVQHGGVPLPLRLLRVLAPSERTALLTALPAQTLAEVVATDLRTIYVETSIPQAVGTLVEWGLEALPVIDRAGRFAGVFGVEQALRAALDARPPDGGPIRDADPPTLVQLVMQTAVPTIAATTSVADALTQLLAAVERFLVVVEAGRPVGLLTDAQVLERLQGITRGAWLEALRVADATLPSVLALAVADQTVGTIAGPAPTISARSTQDDATRLMLEHGHERLVVVDDEGRLVGLLARRGLLRALAQASAS